MADSSTTNLPPAGALTGDELVPIVQDGVSAKTTAQAIADRAGSVTRPYDLIVAIGDETTALVAGLAKVTFRAPRAFELSAIKASLTTESSSGIPTFDVNVNGVSILSTKLTIDAGEKTSVSAATAAVLSSTAIEDDAEITIGIDVPGTDAAGAKLSLVGVA